MSYIEIPEEDLSSKPVAVTSKPVLDIAFEMEQEKVNTISNNREKQKAQNNLDAKIAILNVLPDFNTLPEVRNVNDLSKPEVKRKVIRQVEENLTKGQLNLFAEDILNEVGDVYDTIVSEFKKNIIEIPRMDLVQGDVKAEFKFFDLDTTNLNYKALDQEIIRLGLKDKVVETLKAKSSGSYGHPIKMIISELIDYPEIDYE